VIYVVERDDLLYVVSEFVYSDIITFVVHAIFADAGAEVGFFASHSSRSGVSGADGCIYFNFISIVIGFFVREAEFSENGSEITFERFGIRVHRG
jgi:hypothetical protein